MSIYKYGLAAVLAFGLVACGGGGGNAGTPGGGTGGTGGTGGGTTQPVYQVTLQLQNAAGVDIANNSFAASDTVKLLATLKTAAGAPAAYEVVSFAETGSGLLQFTPASATALTDASGQAVVEAKAKDLVSLGATSVTASATVAGTAYSVSRNLAVTSAVVEGVDPQTLVRSVNFLSVVPASSSIVPAGTGGIGRTETAILQFQVLNGQSTGIPGVRVEFTPSAPDVVTLSSVTGITDANGLVSATVSSKSRTATVVIAVSIPGAQGILPTPSGVLTVSNGAPVSRSLDLSASKHVLNNDISGDASTISVRLLDSNGSRVPDGFALVAGANYGGVGNSSGSACTLVNGECSFVYNVQNPRSPNGIIDVLVSGETGNGETISDTIHLYATSVDWVSLYAVNGSTPVTVFSGLKFDASCKAVWSGVLGTANGLAAPAGASLAVESFNSQVGASVSSGSPVPDSHNSGRATDVNLTFTLNNATALGEANLQFTVTAGSFIRKFAAKLNFPACTPAL